MLSLGDSPCPQGVYILGKGLKCQAQECVFDFHNSGEPLELGEQGSDTMGPGLWGGQSLGQLSGGGIGGERLEAGRTLGVLRASMHQGRGWMWRTRLGTISWGHCGVMTIVAVGGL